MASNCVVIDFACCQAAGDSPWDGRAEQTTGESSNVL
jgi:hypothetical protein